ncbi:uncharacterized oxidoreductase SAR2567 [Teleopsis dalmanni]|uniref:uncharacterized oxidoreductase SAR2567 n=1 Tax=Teleopsis dalmanni TaxID=139649 RepID=UPI0018CE64D3|nr:uncharacterized oxidoreductase SAR2567 [Teleopsis dalmanni]
MEPMTALVFAFQLLALFSIAGALLIYLVCKVREVEQSSTMSQHNTVVLVTSADTALGLQLCTHLANKGCRVFAGMKDIHDSLPAKLLTGWVGMREFDDEPLRGSIIMMKLDVTREDKLREAAVSINAHLNAGQHGISAVINTSGSLFRGRIELQEVLQWEHMLKTNILGSLRVAKAFVPFLRPTAGRLIYLGASSSDSEGLVAFKASRVAVETCAEELRKEVKQYGVSVVALDTSGMSAESLYKAPEPQSNTSTEGEPLQYTADILPPSSLQVIDRALWDFPPKERYQLVVPNSKYNFMLPCRSSFRLTKLSDGASRVQKV